MTIAQFALLVLVWESGFFARIAAQQGLVLPTMILMLVCIGSAYHVLRRPQPKEN